VEECYNHNLEKLLKAANLKADVDADTLANPTFSGNWGIAKDWQASAWLAPSRRGSRSSSAGCGYDDPAAGEGIIWVA
jgi:hypothetical protein